MKDEAFENHRRSFRHAMIEAPRKELEKLLRVLEKLNTFDQRQRQHLIDDVRLMVSYKNRIDFDELVKPLLVDWGINGKAE